MPVFLSEQELSRDDLKLRLTNDLGQEQDAMSVNWTIYDQQNIPVSGRSLPAIRRSPGNYYAHWLARARTGSYLIVWEITEWPDGNIRTHSDSLFIIDPSSYSGFGFRSTDIPSVGTKVFVAPSWLTPDDLVMTLRNPDGFVRDAYSVIWSVFRSNGQTIIPRTYASRKDEGIYFAQFLANIPGEYSINWEWQETEDSPLQSANQQFSVISGYQASFHTISGCNPLILLNSSQSCDTGCGSGFSSDCGCDCLYPPSAIPVNINPILPAFPPMVQNMSNSSCSFEFPRTIHIPYSDLPLNSVFTSQAPYQLATGIRRITFYVTYARGAAGGYASFKLMWSNGIEETQETVLDIGISNESPSIQVQNLYLQDLRGPIPEGPDPISFVLQAVIPGGAVSTRLLAAERGSILFPGKLGITITAST